MFRIFVKILGNDVPRTMLDQPGTVLPMNLLTNAQMKEIRLTTTMRKPRLML